MVQTNKIETVEQTRERLSRAQAVVVVQYQGMTVAQLRDLRKQLREVEGELKVIKNRLVKRALAENGFDALDSSLTGPTAPEGYLAARKHNQGGPALLVVDFGVVVAHILFPC